MPTLNSSILLIATPAGELNISTDSVASTSEAVRAMSSKKTHSYDVIVISPIALGLDFRVDFRLDFLEAFKKLKSENPATQVVLFASQAFSGRQEPASLARIIEVFDVCRISDELKLQSDILLALEKAQEKKQQIHLEQLVQEQKEKLKILYENLEQRVDKRQKFLLDAKKKTFLAHCRWESLRQVMVAAHQSLSVSEMERNVTRTLSTGFDIQNLRIIFHTQDESFLNQIRVSKEVNILPITLYQGVEKKGTIFFFRSSKRAFNREENDFLHRIAEGVALALDRLEKLEQTVQLRDQWQATFNSVSDPIALINQNYEIVQTNSTLESRVTKNEKVIGRKCYKVLFQRENPCGGCRPGESFRLEGGKSRTSIFDVYSQNLDMESLDGPVYFNQYHDVTEQIRMERKILESARLAEIGTIGSSIAHELNNPLGGILSFVQLIKMELKSTDSIYPDIIEMEKGVYRCQEIIQNLLSFVRNPEDDEEVIFDLKDPLQRALKLIEIQTKSRGIDVRLTLGENPAPFKGHMNLLTQTIKNVLQNSIDSLLEASQQIKFFQGALEVRMSQTEDLYQIFVLDNGTSRESAASLGLSVAKQILHDYGGNLEIGLALNPLRFAKITLPRPIH